MTTEVAELFDERRHTYEVRRWLGEMAQRDRRHFTDEASAQIHAAAIAIAWASDELQRVRRRLAELGDEAA